MRCINLARVSFAIVLLLFAAANANAQAPQTFPPAALKAWEAHARRYCRTVGAEYAGAKFEPLPPAGVEGSDVPAGAGRHLAADFNGDGKADFVLATPNGGCAGHNEGRNGPQLVVDFVLSTASGYAMESQGAPDGYYDTLVMQSLRPSWVQRRGNADVLRHSTGSAGAGRCGPLPAEVVWGWNGRNIDVIERYDAEGQPVDDQGCRV